MKTARQRREALNTLMIEAPYTSAELSDITGYHEVTIRRWRSGHTRLSSRTWRFIQLAEANHRSALTLS